MTDENWIKNLIWIETTLKKSKKKICLDMFVTESHGEFEFCRSKNGKMKERIGLTVSAAIELQRKYKLIPVNSGGFHGCFTYRTVESNALIASLL